MDRIFRCTCLAAVALLLKACTMTSAPVSPQQYPYSLPQTVTAGEIFHVPTGYRVQQEVVIDHARRTQVVYVGETHDSPAAHRIQEELLQALTAGNPGKVALAMEMFTPSQQAVLDRWSAGELSEKELLQQVDWYSTWGIDFALYRDLLLFCRDHGIKILALNVERNIRDAVSKSPADELPPEIRDQLPEMDFDDPYYNAMIAAFHAGHPMDQRRIDGFRRVQTLWDESMAARLADYLRAKGEDHQVMVVAGGNHIQYGFGIPRRLFRRFPASYLLIGTTETKESQALDPTRIMNVENPDHPLLPYHFLYVTTYEKLPRTGVKLGVMVTAEVPQGVLIRSVVPDSTAAQYNLQVGDLLLNIDDEPLTDTYDLIYTLKQKQIGDTVTIELLRGDEKISLEVEFTTENQHQQGMRQK